MFIKCVIYYSKIWNRLKFSNITSAHAPKRVPAWGAVHTQCWQLPVGATPRLTCDSHWEETLGAGAHHGLVRTPEKGKLCSLFAVFFLDVFDNPPFINTRFKEDSFVHLCAPSAQGINHGQRRTRSHMKNIYVLIVLRAWPGNWEFKGQKFYFVFLIFQEIKRPTTQRLIEIHFLLSSAC